MSLMGLRLDELDGDSSTTCREDAWGLSLTDASVSILGGWGGGGVSDCTCVKPTAADTRPAVSASRRKVSGYSPSPHHSLSLSQTLWSGPCHRHCGPGWVDMSLSQTLWPWVCWHVLVTDTVALGVLTCPCHRHCGPGCVDMSLSQTLWPWVGWHVLVTDTVALGVLTCPCHRHCGPGCVDMSLSQTLWPWVGWHVLVTDTVALGGLTCPCHRHCGPGWVDMSLSQTLWPWVGWHVLVTDTVALGVLTCPCHRHCGPGWVDMSLSQTLWPWVCWHVLVTDTVALGGLTCPCHRHCGPGWVDMWDHCWHCSCPVTSGGVGAYGSKMLTRQTELDLWIPAADGGMLWWFSGCYLISGCQLSPAGITALGHLCRGYLNTPPILSIWGCPSIAASKINGGAPPL